MNRDIHIDIAQGLAIFCVVAGHIVPGTPSNIIYLFHMPLFFMISGYLYTPDRDCRAYFRRKTLSLLVPYVIYLSVFESHSVAFLLSEFCAHPDPITASAFFKYLAKLIYGGEYLKGTVGVFWFVTCLFLTQQLFNCIAVRTNNTVVVSSAILLYVISYINQMLPVHIIFPWAANVVCCSFLFYSVGAVFGQYIFKRHDKAVLFLSVLISMVSFILTGKGFNLSFNMKYTYYGWFVVSPIAAIGITTLVALVAHTVSQCHLTTSWLGYTGRASITIMYTHQFLGCVVLKDPCKKWPWGMSILICIIGCALHYVFSTTRLSRALLLGSRNNI